MLLNCLKLLRILIMVCLLHSACSAILEAVKDSFSNMSRMNTSFEGESLGAISPGLTTVSGMPPCRKLRIATKRGGRWEERGERRGVRRNRRACMKVSRKIQPSLY